MEYPDLYPNDFFDGTLQPYSQLSAVTGDTQLRIPVEWLEVRA